MGLRHRGLWERSVQQPSLLLPNCSRTRNWSIQGAAVEALARIGPKAKTVVPALTELLKDETWSVRKMAAEALEKIRKEEQQGGNPGQEERPARTRSPLGGGMF